MNMREMKSKISERDAFLNELKMNDKKCQNPKLLYDIILSNDPALFMDVNTLLLQMLEDGRLNRDRLPNYFMVSIVKNDIFSRITHICRSEPLIETILKVTMSKGEKISDEEKRIFKRILAICVKNGMGRSTPLKYFLENATPLFIQAFFSQLNDIMTSNPLDREEIYQLFLRMSRGGLLFHSAKHNHIAVLKGLKSVNIPLDTKMGGGIDQLSAMHALAGSATIDTAKFLLTQGIDINIRDGSNCTPLAYIFEFIDLISLQIIYNSRFNLIDYEYELDTEHSALRRFMKDIKENKLPTSGTALNKLFQSSVDKAIFALEHGAEVPLVEYEIFLMTETMRVPPRPPKHRLYLSSEGNYIVQGPHEGGLRGGRRFESHIPLAELGLESKTFPENPEELKALFRARAPRILAFTLNKGHTESPYSAVEKTQGFLMQVAQLVYKKKDKFQELSFANIQYLRGLMIKALIQNEQRPLPLLSGAPLAESEKTFKLKEQQKQVLHLFKDAALQGHVNAAIKLAEHYLSIHEEDEAFIWYQQAHNNSSDPESSLLSIIGTDNMIKLAHGMGIRKGESKYDLQKPHRTIMHELAGMNYPEISMSLPIQSLLLLGEAVMDYDPQSSQLMVALQFMRVAYIRAITENRLLLPQIEDATRHVMNFILASTLLSHEREHFAAVQFMPEDPVECKDHHYLRLCEEFVNVNLAKGDQDRVKHWQLVISSLTQMPAFLLQDNPFIESPRQVISQKK